MSSETPRKPRSISEPGYTFGGLERARSALLNDLRVIPEIDTAANMFAAVLPPVTDAKVSATLDQLRKQKVVVLDPGLSCDVWSAFKPTPTDAKSAFQLTNTNAKDGGASFKPLESLFAAIVEASKSSKCLVTLKTNGRRSPWTPTRYDMSNPDGSMLLIKSVTPKSESPTNRDDWGDMPVFLECKLTLNASDVCDVSVLFPSRDKPDFFMPS